MDGTVRGDAASGRRAGPVSNLRSGAGRHAARVLAGRGCSRESLDSRPCSRGHFTSNVWSLLWSYDPRWASGNQWVMANRPTPPPLAILKILPDGRESVIAGTGGAGCILDDVSKDGHFCYAAARCPGTCGDTTRRRADPRSVRKAPAGSIDQPQFSPDGRWVAYNGNESGRHEVYVTAFPRNQRPVAGFERRRRAAGLAAGWPRTVLPESGRRPEDGRGPAQWLTPLLNSEAPVRHRPCDTLAIH